MKRSAGFTLIELVIVIVILGILGAVAAPKFLNLQGDAYKANIKSLAGSLQSATTLANTKAILEGKDKDTTTAGEVTGYNDVKFKHGFPIADTLDGGEPKGDGILGALQSVPSANDYSFTSTPEEGDPKVLTITPNARNARDTNCFVKYTEAEAANKPAKVEFDNSGC